MKHPENAEKVVDGIRDYMGTLLKLAGTPADHEHGKYMMKVVAECVLEIIEAGEGE